MNQTNDSQLQAKVLVIADVESNAVALVEDILHPAGIEAWRDGEQCPSPDVLVVDVTQLMGDPLAGLRSRRTNGDVTPSGPGSTASRHS